MNRKDELETAVEQLKWVDEACDEGGAAGSKGALLGEEPEPPANSES